MGQQVVMADGVTLRGALRATAADAEGGLVERHGSPDAFAWAWLDDWLRVNPDRRDEAVAAVRDAGLGDDKAEHSALVDYFVHGDLAHWLWPAARDVLSQRPDVASYTLRRLQPGAPAVRLDQVADRLATRHAAMSARAATLWTLAPAPAMRLVWFRDEVAEAVASAEDWDAAGDLSFLVDAAADSTWVAAAIPWLATRSAAVAIAPALAPWREPRSAPPYAIRPRDPRSRGRLTWGPYNLQGKVEAVGVANLRDAVVTALGAAAERGWHGLKPLGWVDRLLAAHRAWRPLVDAALADVAAQDDACIGGLVDWALSGGLTQHAPRALVVIVERSPADADVLKRQVERASGWALGATDLGWLRAGAATPADGVPPGRLLELQGVADLERAVVESLSDGRRSGDDRVGALFVPDRLHWLLPLLTHATGPAADALCGALGPALARNLAAADFTVARDIVGLGIASPDKATLADVWVPALERRPAWLSRVSGFAGLSATMGDLLLELRDHGLWQRWQAPRAGRT